MELPEHVLAEEMASLDQQELLPVEVSSSAQSTGMQAEAIQVDEKTKFRRQLQLALLQKAMSRMHKLGTLEGVECEDDSSFQQQLQEIMLDLSSLWQAILGIICLHGSSILRILVVLLNPGKC